MVLGFCLLFCSHGEENESQTALQRTKLVPVSTTGPGAMHQNEVRAELFLMDPYLLLDAVQQGFSRLLKWEGCQHNNFNVCMCVGVCVGGVIYILVGTKCSTRIVYLITSDRTFGHSLQRNLQILLKSLKECVQQGLCLYVYVYEMRVQFFNK